MLLLLLLHGDRRLERSLPGGVGVVVGAAAVAAVAAAPLGHQVGVGVHSLMFT